MNTYLWIIIYVSDKSRVVQRSTSPLVLSTKKAIPIYCVVSGHCIYDEYAWDCIDKRIPGNTPVLWVNLPGAYRCRITRGGQVCYSAIIVVELPANPEGNIHLVLYRLHACASVHG